MTSVAQDKGAAARQRLLDGVAAITSGEGFKAWLKALRRFHTYSVGNVFLIYSQMPNATRVAGFTTWKGMGRSVRKGEHGLTILAPRMVAFDDEQADGTVQRRQRLIGFTPVYVFDVSQTEGKPLPDAPTPVLLTDDSPHLDAIWGKLEAFNVAQGVKVTRLPMMHDTANGYYIATTGGRQIVVKETSPMMQQVKTLIHESTHAQRLAGYTRQEDFDHSTEELVAESVAYLVMDTYGMPSDQYTMPYLAAYSGGEPERVLKVMESINKITHTLIEAIGEVG
jgi:antirestriction protein ArdC